MDGLQAVLIGCPEEIRSLLRDSELLEFFGRVELSETAVFKVNKIDRFKVLQ